MPQYLDRCQFTTATTGTGTITVGSAVSKYQTPASAGATDGQTYSYFIEDGTAWEVGTGTYTVSGTTLTRSLIQSSTGSLLSLSGSAVVTLAPTKTDLGPLANHPGYVSGRWYLTVPGAAVANGTGFTGNVIRMLPFYIKDWVTISDLGARIVTLFAGGNIQLGIYASNPTTKYPTGPALTSTPSISTAATGVVNSGGALTGGNVTLNPGFYWMAANADNGTVACQTLAGTSIWGASLVGSATQGNITTGTNTFLGIGVSGGVTTTFGTWPDVTSATFSDTTTGGNVLVHIKVA